MNQNHCFSIQSFVLFIKMARINYAYHIKLLLIPDFLNSYTFLSGFLSVFNLNLHLEIEIFSLNFKVQNKLFFFHKWSLFLTVNPTCFFLLFSFALQPNLLSNLNNF